MVCCGGLGPPALVALLLAAGADAQAVDNTGWCPLVFVASSGQLPLLDLLLAAGAAPNPAPTQDGGGWTPLARAAYRGHGAVVARLLAAGADPAVPAGGRTPAEHAAAGGHVDVAAELAGWRPAAPAVDTALACEG